ncbi:High-affinity nicotinic acid transporter [Fulvia fulva]|nr:High-affinity nicotinic acid transporter [Fulvia fulva]WPV25196.1 High-affinity nicotinic acid transporter [Fulvia fulva]
MNTSRRFQQRHDEEQQTLIGGERNATQPANDDSTLLNRRTVRKLDTILLPFLALLFLLNSLDKSNIGNAETAGFTHDTGLSRNDVNTSMAVFFFVFVLLQPLGAALGRKFGMRRYVPICMSIWGLTTILHVFVSERWHLIVLRVMLAVLEAGFYPTTVSYMSLFYTKYEFAFRLGFFYGMSAVSGMLGGVLSWAVFSHFEGHGDGGGNTPELPPTRRHEDRPEGLKSWEILFLIEGCMTMAVALVGFFWLPKSADTAWFFTREERDHAEQRMLVDTLAISEPQKSNEDSPSSASRYGEEDDRERPMPVQGEGTGDGDHERLLGGNNLHETLRRTVSGVSGHPITEDSGLTKQDILSAIFNYKIWHLLFVNILSAIPATAFGVLLPILVKELSPSLNLSPAASNLLSAPPFAFGAVALFVFTIWSDRSRKRLTPVLWGLALLLIGLMMTILSPLSNYWLRYFSLCVLLSGSYIASPLTVAWLTNNTPEPGKRAILLGINGWGNLAGCFMSVLFTPEGEETGYFRSFLILLICVLISFAGFVLFRAILIRENRYRDNVLRSWSDEEKEREELVGDIPAPDNFGQRLARKLGLLALAKRAGSDEARKGDEKLTYRYSL